MARVVITGVGPVTPVGIGKDELWHAIENEVSPAGGIQSIGIPQYAQLQGAELTDFVFASHLQRYLQTGQIERKLFNKMRDDCDRAIQFAVVGTKLAIEDAGLSYTGDNAIGVFLGNADGCAQLYERQIELTIQKVVRRISESLEVSVKPFGLFKARQLFKEYAALCEKEHLREFIVFLNERFGTIHTMAPPSTIDFRSYSIPARVCSCFGFHGPSLAINTACASGLDAVGQAYIQLRHGVCDIAVCGGSEAPVSLEILTALDNLGVISRTTMRPYDEERDGFAIGEGAGIVILENLQSARKRGAHIYAEVSGYRQSHDANRNIVMINGEGRFLRRAIEGALSEAAVDKESIAYINSHGTATKDCDRVETAVFKQVFGDHAYKVNISSTKPVTGHSFGAVGGIEVIIASLAINRSLIPPTLNLENPSAECDLNYTPRHAVDRKIPAALITSMGFGGYNSALVLSTLALQV